MHITKEIKTVFNKQLKNTKKLSVNERLKYLDNIKDWINSHRQQIIGAHYSDLRKPDSEVELTEIWYVFLRLKL